MLSHALRACRSLGPLLLLSSLAACSAEGGAAEDANGSDPARRSGPVAFVGVHVVPMTGGGVLEERTVLVEEGRIARIGPAAEVEVPEGARRVDGRGRWLIPGLGEMHAHVPSQGDDPEEARASMERVLFLYLSNGITTARGMLGAPVHLELREAIARGEVLGPRLYTSGPSINGNSVPDPDSARRAVLHQHAAGYDFLKIHDAGLGRASYDAMARTADSVGIPWAGHVPADVGLLRALEAGQASIDHLDQYVDALLPEGAEPPGASMFFGVNLVEAADASRIPEVARATREAGVWNVPTQSLIEHVLSPDWSPEEMAEWPEMRYVAPETLDAWVRAKRNFLANEAYTEERARAFIELRRRIIGGLHEAGAKLLLGSDAPQIFQVPGFSIQAELRMMVASGLSPHDALLAGTRNVAEYFGDLESYGTVEEGKVADLVLLEADPLADIRNVARRAGVMVRGEWLPAEEIERRLEAIAEAGRD